MTQSQTATRRAVIAAVVALALVGLGIFLAVKLWPSSDTNAAAPGPSKTKDLTWQPVLNGIALPVSRSAGPSTTLDGRASGFARSELGAALAAVHLAYRTIPEAGSAVFEATIREQVTGDDAGSLLTRVTQEYETERTQQGVSEGRPLSPGAGRPLAYQVENYSESQANVTLFAGFATDATKYFAFHLQVRWVDGDWRLLAPPGGNVGNVLTQLTSIPSSAVSLVKGS